MGSTDSAGDSAMSFDYENVWSTIEEIDTNAILLINIEGYIENINLKLNNKSLL